MSTSTAFIADPPVAFRFVSFVSGERDWVREEGAGTDLAWGRGGGRSALRCLVGTVSEGVSVGRSEMGKEEKDLRVEQFREGGFFVLCWIWIR